MTSIDLPTSTFSPFSWKNLLPATRNVPLKINGFFGSSSVFSSLKCRPFFFGGGGHFYSFSGDRFCRWWRGHALTLTLLNNSNAVRVHLVGWCVDLRVHIEKGAPQIVDQKISDRTPIFLKKFFFFKASGVFFQMVWIPKNYVQWCAVPTKISLHWSLTLY